MQEERILERIAQSSLASLPDNRICKQPVPCHANSHNYCIIPVWELIVKPGGMILVSARNTAQEWESIFLHRLCPERPVECFERGSLVKTFSFCDILLLELLSFM